MANYQIRQFRGDIDAWIKAASGGMEDTLKIFIEEVHKALVMGSPVDTGRFRANWQITFNAPPMYALNQYDKSGSETIAYGKRVASVFTLRRGAAITSIYFSNMLIYANALEYGHSKQAPAGVVGVVAIRLRSFMADAVRQSRAKNAL